MRIPPVSKGYKRAWYKCRTCGRALYRDFVPYSLSNPILVPPCGHGAVERDYGLIRITAKEARGLLAAKAAYG